MTGMEESQKAIARRLHARGIAHVPEAVQGPDWYRRVMAWVREENEAKRQAAVRSTAEQPPQPVSLVEELRREVTKHQTGGDAPALNSSLLLQIAGGTDVPRSTREAVADLLRQTWDTKHNGKETDNG
jgi:hypothetical protein